MSGTAIALVKASDIPRHCKTNKLSWEQEIWNV